MLFECQSRHIFIEVLGFEQVRDLQLHFFTQLYSTAERVAWAQASLWRCDPPSLSTIAGRIIYMTCETGRK